MTETYWIEDQQSQATAVPPRCQTHGVRKVLPVFSSVRVCLECNPEQKRPCGRCRVPVYRCSC